MTVFLVLGIAAPHCRALWPAQNICLKDPRSAMLFLQQVMQLGVGQQALGL